MPVTKPDGALFDIKELTLTYQGGHYGLSLRCPRATAYLLCFSRQCAPADPQALGLTEADLQALHNGQSMEKGPYRLMGVPAGTFHAMPSFYGFSVAPPQTIQVWSMLAKPGGSITLYLPREAAAICHVPLRYSVKLQQNAEGTVLQVLLDKQYLEHYQPGALYYQVDQTGPVPLPASWLNREIPLAATAEQISVAPSPGAEQDYELVP